MQRQFYSEVAERSSGLLHRLAGKVDFVLIGGWAVHSYINLQRSMDLDMAVSYKSLDYFRGHGIQKYERLNIDYSVIDGVTVDLFIPGFTDKDLPFPVGAILSNYLRINNIKVVKREMLLLLKVWGYFGNDETKIKKDIIDVVGLLFYGDMDMDEVKRLIKKYGLERRRTTDVMLEYLDKGRALSEFVTEAPKDYSILAEKCKKKIRSVFGY